AIVFTGGIGENDSNIRKLSVEGLENFGIKLDQNVNDNLPRNAVCKISDATSNVLIYRLPTDEELVIARDTFALVK
ncbi:MAG: acetate kinase, partial [Clostridia bacterium]